MNLSLNKSDRVGEIVWVRIWNSTENPRARGKLRPAILVEDVDGQWNTLGLTTNPQYLSGQPRVAVSNWRQVGLKCPGYIWGNRLTRVSYLDLGDHIGWVDESLVTEIESLLDLHPDVLTQLRLRT